jgi:hypothetical protein
LEEPAASGQEPAGKKRTREAGAGKKGKGKGAAEETTAPKTKLSRSEQRRQQLKKGQKMMTLE